MAERRKRSPIQKNRIKKRALRKEKRDVRALSLAATRPSTSMPAVPVLVSALPSPSASASASASVFIVSVLASSALPSASGVSVLVPGSSALLSSTLPSASSMSVPVPELSAPSSVSSVSGVSVPVRRLSAPPSMSVVLVPEPGLSPPPLPTWSDPQIPMSLLGRQKLSQWSGILKRASSEEAPTTCAILFLPSEFPSPLLFPSSGIGKKQLFDKAFNINCRPLANDNAGKDVGQRKFDKTFINTWPLADYHAEEEVDLSFIGCGCFLGVKLNKPWQIELLERRPACIIKTIPLAAAIFWDPNFVPCSRPTLNLAKKWASKQENFLIP